MSKGIIRGKTRLEFREYMADFASRGDEPVRKPNSGELRMKGVERFVKATTR